MKALRPDTLTADDVRAFVRRLAEPGEDVVSEARSLVRSMRGLVVARGATREAAAALFPPDGSASVDAFALCLKLTAAEVWGIVDDGRLAVTKEGA